MIEQLATDVIVNTFPQDASPVEGYDRGGNPSPPMDSERVNWSADQNYQALTVVFLLMRLAWWGLVYREHSEPWQFVLNRLCFSVYYVAFSILVYGSVFCELSNVFKVPFVDSHARVFVWPKHAFFPIVVRPGCF